MAPVRGSVSSTTGPDLSRGGWESACRWLVYLANRRRKRASLLAYRTDQLCLWWCKHACERMHTHQPPIDFTLPLLAPIRGYERLEPNTCSRLHCVRTRLAVETMACLRHGVETLNRDRLAAVLANPVCASAQPLKCRLNLSKPVHQICPAGYSLFDFRKSHRRLFSLGRGPAATTVLNGNSFDSG